MNEWPCNLVGVFALGTFSRVSSFMAPWLIVIEKIPTGGGFSILSHLLFPQNFIEVFMCLSLVSQPACSQSTFFVC